MVLWRRPLKECRFLAKRQFTAFELSTAAFLSWSASVPTKKTPLRPDALCTATEPGTEKEVHYGRILPELLFDSRFIQRTL